MTATNHALTGAAIAMVVKQPALAVPLAFLSHFVLDLIPHYNPEGVSRDTYVSHSESWSKKMRFKSFRLIFITDMSVFVLSLFVVPFWLAGDVNYWVILLCMVAAASPDFAGGIEYLWYLVSRKKIGSSRFDKWHVWLQWSEKPWGIYIELIYLIIVAGILYSFSQ